MYQSARLMAPPKAIADDFFKNFCTESDIFYNN